MILTLFDKVSRTADVTSFYFKPGNPIKWEAGQYLQYTLPHDNPDDRGVVRFFTISSAPFEEDIMLTTRFAGDASSTFKKALFKMEIGQTISASIPQGEFVIKDFLKSYVLIAGGIGITSYRSILLDLGINGQLKDMDILLVYCNKDYDIVFKEELENLVLKNPLLKIRYVINPERCNIELIRSIVPGFKEKIYYLSGPIGMVESIEVELRNEGIGDEGIKEDYFPGY